MILLFLLLPLLGLVYVGWHIWHLLPLKGAWVAAILFLMVSAFAMFFASIFRATDRLPMPLATAVYEVGMSSTIVLLYLFMLFLVLDLGQLLHVIPAAWLRDNWWTVGCIGLFLFGLFAYGNIHYRHKYCEEMSIRSAKVTKPVKLLLLSDLHLGYHNRRKEFARWVDLINNEKPDLILMAGDVIDGSMRPLWEEEMHQGFQRLEAPIYACLGNHELYSGKANAVEFYQKAGIHLLQDTTIVTGDLCIIGRDDRSNPKRSMLEDIMQNADRSKYCILLDHQPYHLEQAEQQQVDFQFSGHTHHGQIWPISWITEAMYECAHGFTKRGNTNYYISSGMGIWGGKFRIGTRSEYVVLTIEPAA